MCSEDQKPWSHYEAKIHLGRRQEKQFWEVILSRGSRNTAVARFPWLISWRGANISSNRLEQKKIAVGLLPSRKCLWVTLQSWDEKFQWYCKCLTYVHLNSFNTFDMKGVIWMNQSIMRCSLWALVREIKKSVFIYRISLSQGLCLRGLGELDSWKGFDQTAVASRKQWLTTRTICRYIDSIQ